MQVRSVRNSEDSEPLVILRTTQLQSLPLAAWAVTIDKQELERETRVR